MTGDRFFGSSIEPADFSNGVPEQNLTFLVGTTGSQNVSRTANTTNHAAVAFWHFAQTWFEEFPQYKPADEQISLFTESYGGHYGPSFVSCFMHQNELIANGTISGPGVHYLHLNTLGIVNGCVDRLTQSPTYATFAWNNTYGVKAFNESQYYGAMYELYRPDGDLDKLRECGRLQKALDPDDYGNVERVNTFCNSAITSLSNHTAGVYLSESNNGWFDVTHPAADPFPYMYSMGFLNQHWVQAALGVPVNHTFASSAVSEGFQSTGDMARGGLLTKIGWILDHGVRVAMMYGDRDYACNWIGGEAASLKVPWSHKNDFEAAGYTTFAVSPLHSGGLTRQYGNFSFTRVYQAGHMVPSYQPEAAYEIFTRALMGRDIATGTVDLQEAAAAGDQYSTEGPSDTWWMKNDVLPSPPHECYLWDTGRCNKEEIQWILDGTAIVKDWVVVGKEHDSSSSPRYEELLQMPLSPK